MSRRLAEMIPAAAGETDPGHSARLSRRDGIVHVELLSANGDRLEERDLAAGENCSDLAGAIAVVIAAWEADLDPRLTARVSLPAPPRPPADIAAVPAPPPAPRRPTAFDVGIGLVGSLTGGQIAPGARVGWWIAPGGGRLGLGVSASGATARSETIGPRADAARWTRVALGIGPQARFGAARTTLDVHVQALAAALHVEGVGLTTNSSGTSAQFGASTGVQVGRWWGNSRPWIGIDLMLWPGHERLEIAGQAGQGELPRVEVQLAVGLSVGRSP